MATDFEASVLILYHRIEGSSQASDAGVRNEVAAVSAALDTLGRPYRVVAVDSTEEAVREILRGTETIVFNLVESLAQRAETAVYVPAICEALGREATGGDSGCLALTRDKILTRSLLQMARLPVPAGVSVYPKDPVPFSDLPPGPYLVKPAWADGSEGIRAETSVVSEAGPMLVEAVGRIHRSFAQPALVEQLVGSREINVSLLEVDHRLEVLPLAEIDFSAFENGQPRIVDYAAKWEPESFSYQNTPRIIPPDLPPAVIARIRKVAIAAWRITGCRDYARVDMRLDDQGRLFLLEVNANPDISPDAGFPAALTAAGRTFSSFVDLLLENALRRLERRRQETGFSQARKKTSIRKKSVEVRPIESSDQTAIIDILRTTPVFRPDEVAVAEEVLAESISHGLSSGYQSLVATSGEDVTGWICFGPTPCTLGTYDIYWLVVHPQARRHGVGTALMEAAESKIWADGGRLIVLDTSGSDVYAPTRRFYHKLGYKKRAQITDFYSPGDDKLILGKRL